MLHMPRGLYNNVETNQLDSSEKVDLLNNINQQPPETSQRRLAEMFTS